MPTVSDYRAILGTLENEAFRWNATLDPGFPVIVTYSFYEDADLPDVDSLYYSADTTQAFSEAQRAAFRSALDVFAGVTGVLFVETTGDAMIRTHGVTGSSWAGWSTYPVVTETRTDSSVSVFDQTDGDLISGFDFDVLLHEIGHTMGLSHPHEGEYRLPADLDNTDITLMSFNWAEAPKGVLEEMDKAALQFLYGAALDTTGWSYGIEDGVFTLTASDGDDRLLGVAGGNDISGGAGDDVIVGRQDDDTLRGDGGNDRLLGKIGADTLEGGEGSDRIYGGNGDDTLSGGAGDDRLYGGEGGDELSGGDGNDILIAGRDDAVVPEGVSDILHGDGGNDRLKGNRSDNVLDGGDGDDRAIGKSGADSIDGGAGADVLIGARGKDRLTGGDGDDLLSGGKRGDVLTGGEGSDVFLFIDRGHRARDLITDFELGVDRLEWRTDSFSLDDVALFGRNGGADTVLKVGADDADAGFKVYLEGVAKSDLAAILEDGLFL
mgnify:CR=1 FL=1